MRPRRRRDPFWDDDPFFEEFERMRQYMEEIMRRVWSEPMREGQPFVYGFSMRMGPDGKPIVQEFGNTRRVMSGTKDEVPELEPLTDVNEDGQYVYVTVELPGVEKEEISLNATEEELSISVDGERRRYYKEIEMPATVEPESARASYRNGVLEVRLKKKYQKKGKKIAVE